MRKHLSKIGKIKGLITTLYSPTGSYMNICVAALQVIMAPTRLSST
jgi:hypothetical protein